MSLAGTHLDVPGLHAVSQQDGQNFARKHGINVCMEVSANTKEGVDNLFGKIAS